MTAARLGSACVLASVPTVTLRAVLIGVASGLDGNTLPWTLGFGPVWGHRGHPEVPLLQPVTLNRLVWEGLGPGADCAWPGQRALEVVQAGQLGRVD